MRWKFAKGDVIRYETSLVETLTVAKQQYRNEKSFRFRWTVFDVDESGMALIVVAFERVRLNLQSPEFRYDSDEDKPNVEPSGDRLQQAELLAARAMIATEMFLKAISRGGNTQPVGGDSIFGASSYTPGDFPALPGGQVKVGDSWRISVGVNEALQQSAGFSDHVVKSHRNADGRQTLVIECRTEMGSSSGRAFENRTAQVLPVTTVNEFDKAAGRFLSRTIEGGSVVADALGNEIRRTHKTIQQLLPADDSRMPARSPVLTLELSPTQQITIAPHHKWNDLNKNGVGDGPEEFEGIGNIFTVEDNVCLAVLVAGLQGTKFRFDILSTSGQIIASSNIPLAADGVFVHRELKAAEFPGPGVYFLHWYLNDAFAFYTTITITRPVTAADLVTSSIGGAERKTGGRQGPVER